MMSVSTKSDVAATGVEGKTIASALTTSTSCQQALKNTDTEATNINLMIFCFIIIVPF